MTFERGAYAGFMLLAAGVFFLIRRCHCVSEVQRRLPRAEKFCLAGAAFVGGVFGAKLPFLISPASIGNFAWLADGKTITTGLIGAYLSVELVKWLLGIRFKTGDSYALPLAAAIGVGRWGCFFNGCCAGTPTSLPWGVDFGDGIPRHPTQIYESLFHYLMTAVIFFVMWKTWIVGHRLQLYLIAYCVYRFLSEFIRHEPVYAGLTFYQWTSLFFGVGLAVQWAFEDRRAKSKPSI